jgi:hypothetical protein
MQFPYDDQLAGLVANDATSIDDVVKILQAVDALLDGTKDGLKWFNTLYLQVTLKVRESEPTKFIADLDFKFANLYLTALRGWLAGGGLPESWRIMFEQRANARLARIQFALAGVNAHINRDLAVAVVKTCQPRHGSEEYREYTDINVILDSLIEQAKRELMVTLPGDTLPGADKVELLVGAWGVAAARETAWVHAEILAAIEGDAGLAARFVDGLDGTAALAGKALLLVMV